AWQPGENDPRQSWDVREAVLPRDAINPHRLHSPFRLTPDELIGHGWGAPLAEESLSLARTGDDSTLRIRDGDDGLWRKGRGVEIDVLHKGQGAGSSTVEVHRLEVDGNPTIAGQHHQRLVCRDP